MFNLENHGGREQREEGTGCWTPSHEFQPRRMARTPRQAMGDRRRVRVQGEETKAKDMGPGQRVLGREHRVFIKNQRWLSGTRCCVAISGLICERNAFCSTLVCFHFGEPRPLGPGGVVSAPGGGRAGAVGEPLPLDRPWGVRWGPRGLSSVCGGLRSPSRAPHPLFVTPAPCHAILSPAGHVTLPQGGKADRERARCEQASVCALLPSSCFHSEH